MMNSLQILRLLPYLAFIARVHGMFHELNKRSEEPDYPIEEYLENCGMTHKISAAKPFKFSTPYFGSHQYPASLDCSWSFIGDHGCTASISCPTFDLRNEADCEEEHLQVYDGLGGHQRFCPGKQVDKIKARNNGHDLFVRLRTTDSPKFSRLYKGVLCEVSCKSGKTELTLDPHYANEHPGCHCGTLDTKNTKDRIVGGYDANMGDFPWQVAIVLPGTRKPKCGGSVINDRWILSAAHCFALDSSKPKDFEILMHANILDAVKTGPGNALTTQDLIGKVTDRDEGTQRYKIKKIINHPLFTPKYDFDVALIETGTKIAFGTSNVITPICLPAPLAPREDLTGKTATVAGWGKPAQDASSTMRILQKLNVPLVSRDICTNMFPNRITERMFCAGFEEGGKDACQGDSGGPLVWQNDSSGRFVQIGIVSWGDGCAQSQKPGIYTNVKDVNQWIRYTANSGTWCKG